MNAVAHADRLFEEKTKLPPIPIVSGSTLAAAWKIGGTPWAVLIDSGGIVRAKGLVNHLEHIESLINVLDTPALHGEEASNGLPAVSQRIS